MTETLDQLERRRRTAQELLSVVKTMKSLAAGSIRDYERAAESLEQYSATVDLGFRILLRLRPGSLDEASRDSHAPLLLVLVGSDQGMVGHFNEEIVRHVEEELKNDPDRPSRRVIAVGARLGSFLAAEGIPPDAIIDLPKAAEGIVRRVQELLVTIEDWTRTERAFQILLAHHRPRRQGVYESTKRRLLPLDARWLHEIGADPWPYRGIPAHTMPEQELVSALVSQFMLVSLQRALAQSLAAEQAKRLAAMHAAEKNVLERIEMLQARYRQQRQALITSELLEVTAGFEVLENESD